MFDNFIGLLVYWCGLPSSWFTMIPMMVYLTHADSSVFISNTEQMTSMLAHRKVAMKTVF